jgi:hypothetical protein
MACEARKKGQKTTTPNRIRKWSPTLLLTGRYPGYLRRSDGMRSFLDSMVVDESCKLWNKYKHHSVKTNELHGHRHRFPSES